MGEETHTAGDTEWLHERVKKGLPRLPARAKAAILDFVESRPDFYPVSSWTPVSQLHAGPKVVLMGDAAHTMTPPYSSRASIVAWRMWQSEPTSGTASGEC